MISTLPEYSFEHSLHFSLPPTTSSRPHFEWEGDISNHMSASLLAEASIRAFTPKSLLHPVRMKIVSPIYPFSNGP